MSFSPVIDVHAHILTEEMMARMRREAPEIGPTLTEVDAEGGVLTVGDIVQRPFPRGGWDLDRRLADLDIAGFDLQVLSNCPQTFLYERDAALTGALCQIQNEAIAELVARHPDRFLGIATLPMQDPARAADELRRAVTRLGLKGAQIGSHIEGRNLDHPALEPVWATAAELGAFILIHPQKAAAGDRTKEFYLKNLIGNPLETTIAAASLVFGGVLERYPDLRICLVHGGGFLPFQTGRMIHGWKERPECRRFITESPEVSIRRLYFDTLTHFGPALRYLTDTFAADHVLLGSDYPFDMGTLEGARQVRAAGLDRPAEEAILGRTAGAWFGIKAAAGAAADA
ncbi:amidohydrolase family protein [Ancylobacter sp. SL191]|uniref:amidohydrolase family protein n=1 Tax=Ancylobacter sp. SL191 TaxID=2995166 RepID=UPI002271376F|nr:amidohydrolase family protein [Ancylobacter sp. SL191]WAC29327.1 amidohydrolase family protein [Ancylobacter sp. SL191]